MLLVLDWDAVLKIIAVQVGAHTFDTWFKPVTFVKQEEDTVILGVPNKFFKEWLTDNYQKTICEALQIITGRQMSFSFTLVKQPDPGRFSPENTPSRVEAIPPVKPKPLARSNHTNLNPHYNFERFVVGTSNQFAHATSVSVAENPATNFNPLFIYGGVGLGKTHLLHAIGHRVLALHPGLNVIYISAEEFMNELINAIRFDSSAKFREKYRKIECLLIDDVQFIAGKERTQEEFFHTFNTLHDAGKQIVLTSDKFPKDIPNLESRLRSRFEWGLIADIQPPDTETKIAIINKKAQENNITVPLNVAFYIADHAESNIREIEGFLTRIAAFASITRRTIDLALVNEVMQKVVRESKPQAPTVDEILKVVAGRYGVRVADIKSVSKNKNFVLARQVAMFMARKLTNLSFPDIGEKIGGRDHSTVIYACNKISKMIGQDTQLGTAVMELEKTFEEMR